MLLTDFSKLDLSRLPSPCFVVDEVAVERNLKILHEVQQKSGAKILHALKAFACSSLAPLTGKYLSGTCASGLHEALFAKDYYAGEIHVFSAGYSEADLVQLLDFSRHIVFNSCSQLLRFAPLCKAALEKRDGLSFGLRINPQHSEGEVALYDPCAPGNRLGVTKAVLDKYLLQAEFQQAFELISGLHFHTLCEHDFLPLQRTLAAVEEQFSSLLKTMQWVNFGGGHYITHADYQRDQLIACIRSFSQEYGLQVYLEPGAAVVIGSGILSSEVLDIGFNELPQAILDCSATCHMPDTLEMPYRAEICGAGLPNEKEHTYRLGGLTCLAGDVIGDYSFDQQLVPGQRLLFEDMAHYTLVKTTTFNGTRLPAVAVWNSQTDELQLIREFDYHDFKRRLP